jgi:hypothetical protein
MPVAVDMRDGQPRYLDMNLRHTPVPEGGSVHADAFYIGGYGSDYRRCPCGLEGIHRNRACPKCGLILKDSATLPSVGIPGAMTGYPGDHKKEATAKELAASSIVDRRIEIRKIKLDVDGTLRGKHFRNCDIIGPAILLPIQTVVFTGILFDIADDTMESIIWLPNPAATRVVGAIGVDCCKFEGGRFTNIGFTGTAEVLSALRKIRLRRVAERRRLRAEGL